MSKGLTQTISRKYKTLQIMFKRQPMPFAINIQRHTFTHFRILKIVKLNGGQEKRALQFPMGKL